MSEFEDLRNDLRANRMAIDDANRQLASARERVKQVADRIAALDRVANRRLGRDREERERLRRELAEAQAEVDRHRGTLATAREIEARAAGRFARLSDPREGIARLKDGIPILLMPVRLETRFKDRQLWVRIFPDDCWIDSFDPTLTATEVLNAKAYWTALWQAGGIEDQDRGAWRNLVAAHGSGRASWIVEQFKPIDLASKPSKPRPQDVILTIPLETPLAAGEVAPVLAFWRAVWLADGDGPKTTAAFT